MELDLTQSQWEEIKKILPYVEEQVETSKFRNLLTKINLIDQTNISQFDLEDSLQQLGSPVKELLNNQNLVDQAFLKTLQYLNLQNETLKSENLQYYFFYGSNQKLQKKYKLNKSTTKKPLICNFYNQADEKEFLQNEFQRLDLENKGYISFENLVDFVVDREYQNQYHKTTTGPKKYYKTPKRSNTDVSRNSNNLNQSEIISTNQTPQNSKINIFKPVFQSKKNKKEIVTYETLFREYEKKHVTNQDLREQIKNIKIQLDILKRQNKIHYKPNFQKQSAKKKSTKSSLLVEKREEYQDQTDYSYNNISKQLEDTSQLEQSEDKLNNLVSAFDLDNDDQQKSDDDY